MGEGPATTLLKLQKILRWLNDTSVPAQAPANPHGAGDLRPTRCTEPDRALPGMVEGLYEGRRRLAFP